MGGRDCQIGSGRAPVFFSSWRFCLAHWCSLFRTGGLGLRKRSALRAASGRRLHLRPCSTAEYGLHRLRHARRRRRRRHYACASQRCHGNGHLHPRHRRRRLDLRLRLRLRFLHRLHCRLHRPSNRESSPAYRKHWPAQSLLSCSGCSLRPCCSLARAPSTPISSSTYFLEGRRSEALQQPHGGGGPSTASGLTVRTSGQRRRRVPRWGR
jgi:hypothetical protein